MFSVKFTKLGRHQVTFERRTATPDYEFLFSVVHPHLLSRKIGFAETETADGIIRGKILEGDHLAGYYIIKEIGGCQ